MTSVYPHDLVDPRDWDTAGSHLPWRRGLRYCGASKQSGGSWALVLLPRFSSFPDSWPPRAVATPSAAMRRDIREVLFLIGEAVIIISAIAATFIVAGLAYTVVP